MRAPAKDGSAARSTGAAVEGSRAAGAWGWAFVVLLLVSAGMASVPGGDDPTGTVRNFYDRHAAVVVVAQVVGLLAAAALARFVVTLRRPGGQATAGRPPRGALEVTGFGIVGAAVVTVVPVLWLVAVAGSGSGRLVHGLAVASDLTDVLLFGAVAGWSAALARAARARWLAVVAAAVAVLALARALLILVGSGVLELLAPVVFVGLVAVLSTLLLVRRAPLEPRR